LFRAKLPHINKSYVKPAAMAVLFLVAVLLAGFAGAWLEQRHEHNNVSLGSLGQQKKIVTGESQLISQIARQVGPSVVSVNVDITDTSTDIFGLPQTQQARAAGTGIILTGSGLVMTNRHVVPAGTTGVSVTLSDGTELKDVSVVGRTADGDSLDAAFLKVNDAKGHTLAPARLGSSASLQVGDNVVAIGNALGEFQNTVTSGIVSGFGRSVQAGDSGGTQSAENLVDLIQTDAAINEGNSGGPLVNLNGQVIGMNTAIAGNAQNIGFSIPIDSLKGLIGQVEKNNKVSRPFLGVHYVSLTPSLAGQFNLQAKQGAYIAPLKDGGGAVVVDSPAEKAGIKEKDIILAVDNKKVDQSHSLTTLLGAYQPGDHVQLSVLRGGKTINMNVVLGTLPASQ
jgi:serine protease Do